MTAQPLIIGIAGGSGSGKSTVARHVMKALGAGSMCATEMDGYYRNFATLTFGERTAVNSNHPDAFDWELLIDHPSRLSRREPIEKPVYDFVTHTRRPETVHVEPTDVVVVDGILLFVDARVRDLCGIKVFVDADAD